MLVIDKHHLDTALMVQADVLERIGREVAGITRDLDGKQMQLKRLHATLEGKFRNAAEKMTVGEVNGAVIRDPLHIKDLAHIHDLEFELAEWKALLEGWKARGFALKELVALYSVQYYALTPEGSSRPAMRPAYEPYRRTPHQPDPDREVKEQPRKRTRV